MVRTELQCIGSLWGHLTVTFLFFLPHARSSQSTTVDGAAFQELIRVNMTTQHDSKMVIEQVAFNISYDRGQMHLNGFPFNKGVSRISCKMDTTDYGSPNQQMHFVHEALVSMRLLLFQWPTNSSIGETEIIIQEEVIEIDGNEVYQNVTTEIKLIVNKEMEVLQQMMSDVILKDTLLHSIPRASDVLFTIPNISQAGDQVPQETTGEYNLRQNTTMDEDPFPGKLPETPLQAVIPASSYKVMCQFADYLRDKLCLIWNRLYPVLTNFTEVFFVGIISAAIIVQFLHLVCPLKEQRKILQPTDLKDSALLVPLMFSHEEVTGKVLEAGTL